MAYSAAALARRRCVHVYPAGHPQEGWQCRAFARWDSPGALDGSGLCTAHAGRTRGADTPAGSPHYECQTAPTCRCLSYPFPHRPGGGLCRWPDPPARRLVPRSELHRERLPPRAARGYVAPTVRFAPRVPSPVAGFPSPTVSADVSPASVHVRFGALLALLHRL